MTDTPAANPAADAARLDQAVIARQLREALAARAERLGLDPASIVAPSPGALIARAEDGTLLRVDFRTYQARDLER
jgi:hypothetical protein